MKSEFDFIEFAWNKGVRHVPQPVAADEENHLAVYEFIQGRAPEEKEVSEKLLSEAAHFYVLLNEHSGSAEAAKIGNASESAFSFAGHVENVERRIRSLKGAAGRASSKEKFKTFVDSSLVPAWERAKNALGENSRVSGIDVDSVLSPCSRGLSPSDFGFHNSILQPDGTLRFVDFEYAGWDDPAKTVCDFLLAPRIPVNGKFMGAVIERFSRAKPAGEEFAERVRLLLPIQKIKWCCIFLNPYLPLGEKKRVFAQKSMDLEKHRKTQLKKAAKLLAELE